MIPRNNYLGRLAKWREKQTVKMLSGIRGCGKTTLFAMYIDWLKRTGVNDRQIIFINMEEPENESLLHYQELYSFIKQGLCSGKFTYVFIDEIQHCENYIKVIEALMVITHIDLYTAVSRKEPDFYLGPSGSFIEIKVLPLSFAEYLHFSKVHIPGREEELKEYSVPDTGLGKSPGANIRETDRRLPRQKGQMEKILRREAFNNYLSFGGFPLAGAMGGEAGLIRNIVEGIYNTVLIKDAAPGINDIPLLEQIAKLMSRSIGRPLSAKKISTPISAKGRKISSNTAEMYMQALTSALVFYHAGRFDIKTGKHLKTLGKYYIADLGAGNLLLETPAVGCQLENVVFLELLRRGFQVCIGKYGSEEVHFAAFNNNGENRAYFQVIASIRDTAVLAAKLSPLEKIHDNHPKYILSLDETPFRANHNGIIRHNLIDWLLETK